MKSLKVVNKRKKNFTFRRRNSPIFLQDLDSVDVKTTDTVYNPSFNKLKTYIPTEPLKVCNLRQAFRYESKLKYKLGGECYDYDSEIVKSYLLERLNAPIHISQIIAPKQIDSNCWFNAMFMMFFISDKGRIFFKHLRTLMILGYYELNDVFALLNFIVECCLSGNNIAKSLNTNRVIKKIYEILTSKGENITNIGEPGNPILYYRKLINFLGNNKLQLVVVHNWSDINTSITPHIIVISNQPNSTFKKPVRFKHNGSVYELDSAAIIDNDREHFCSTITCNGVEFVFDGYSKSRLIPFEWKSKINENIDWNFKDNIYEFENDILWNFTKGYSEFCYYRKT